MMCFRESDGKFLWQIVHDKLDEPNDYPKQGIISTPCVEGDRLYYVSNRGEVVCADVKGDEKTGKGKIHWSYDMIKELDVYVGQASSSSPLVFGDYVYALTGNGVDAGNGNVLKQEQEGATRAAMEKPVDKTKEVAANVKEKVTGEPSTSHNKKQ